MRAAFFPGYRTITVGEADIPEPAPGDVLLEVRFCGICGSDLSLYKTGALAGPGVILGHEVSAVVRSDPAGEWQPGTPVAVYPYRGCGKCVWCREGKHRACLDPQDHQVSGFAEFAAVPARTLVPLPDGLDPRLAASAEPLGVAVRAVELAQARDGDLAYVSGLGSIGLFAVCALRAAGCRVVGADPREDRRNLGLEVGCERVIDPAAGDPMAATLEVDPHGPRIAFECAGVPESLQQVFDTCGYDGVVGLLGIPVAPAFLLRMTLRELRAFSLRGPTIESMGEAMALLKDRPEPGKVITDVVPLNRAPEAFEALAEGGPGVKVLVEPGA
jgi:threonine dehydrogenase-like Zn-dependent dehydrogenase